MGGGQIANCKPLYGTKGCFVSGTENPDPEKCQTFATKDGEMGFFCPDEKSVPASTDSPKGPSLSKSAEKFEIKPGMSAEEIKKAADAAASGADTQKSTDGSEDQELLDDLNNASWGMMIGLVGGVPGTIIGGIVGYNFDSITGWLFGDSEKELAANKPDVKKPAAEPEAKKSEAKQETVKPEAAKTEEVKADAGSPPDIEITVRVNWPKGSPFVNDSDALSVMGKFLWFNSLPPEAQQMYKAGVIIAAQRKAQENPGANSVKVTLTEIENEIKNLTEGSMLMAGYPHELPKAQPQEAPAAPGQEGAQSPKKVAKSGGGRRSGGSGKKEKSGGGGKPKPGNDRYAF